MKVRRLLVLFVLLFAFWSALSGRIGPSYQIFGVVGAALVTLASARFLDAALDLDDHPRLRVLAWLGYLGWLLTRMIPSAIAVGRIVLTPGGMPDPAIVRFRTELSSPAARAFLANSITLVPGTMTLDVDEAEFTVHAFTPDAADDLAAATLQRRIGALFGEPDQPVPTLHWQRPGASEVTT